MGRLFRYLLYLIALAVLAFAVWVLFADLPAPERDIVIDLPGEAAE